MQVPLDSSSIKPNMTPPSAVKDIKVHSNPHILAEPPISSAIITASDFPEAAK